MCDSPVNTRGWLRRRIVERRRLVLCWVAIGCCHTNVGGLKLEIGGGRSHRLIIKPLWAAVSFLLSCLHCLSVSLFSLSCYLATEAACSSLCGGQREGGKVSCQSEDRSVHFSPSPCRAICPSVCHSCLHLVDLSLCEWHLGRRGKSEWSVCPPPTSSLLCVWMTSAPL